RNVPPRSHARPVLEHSRGTRRRRRSTHLISVFGRAVGAKSRPGAGTRFSEPIHSGAHVRVFDRSSKTAESGEGGMGEQAAAAPAMTIEVIVHSSDAAALEQLREAVAGLRSRGHQVQGRVTFEAGDAERFAREATDRGVDLVLAAGGDGTLNEVVNGILSEEGVPAERLPRMGIIPLGTANDFANWLEIPEVIADAVAAALTGEPRTIDVGRLNGRYFLNV